MIEQGGKPDAFGSRLPLAVNVAGNPNKGTGASVTDSMIVNWTNKAREQQIEEGTERLAAAAGT